VDRPSVARELRRADILALPNPPTGISGAYTSPLKLFEYLAAGRPIVASDLPAIREVLQDEGPAVLVAPGDAQALAAAITRIAADPVFGQRLARAAYAAAGDYTWERRAERLERLMLEVAR
jgi:glycosyltransferase involved in cell wall biosynthesis